MCVISASQGAERQFVRSTVASIKADKGKRYHINPGFLARSTVCLQIQFNDHEDAQMHGLSCASRSIVVHRPFMAYTLVVRPQCAVPQLGTSYWTGSHVNLRCV